MKQIEPALSAAQFEAMHDALESRNDHNAALLARCLKSGREDLTTQTRSIMRAHDRAGHMPPDLIECRAAISAELRAMAPDCTGQVETSTNNNTEAHETQATTTETATAPEFQRAQPVQIDLRAMVAHGVPIAGLIGLGVNYSGDMANASGQGAIVAAEPCEAFGLRVAVTLEDGRHSTHLPPTSFSDERGSRYAFNQKMHGAPYLAELAAARAALKASEEAAKTAQAQHHAAELQRLSAEFPHLERKGPHDNGGKFAARNIRTTLKRAFPGVKFSVKSDYSAVNVKWTDGPTDAQVNDAIGQFKIVRADYNTDYFYTKASAWSDLYGGVQYLFTHREESPELIASALETFNTQHSTSATTEDWKRQSGPFDFSARDADAYRRWFRETINATEGPRPQTASKSKTAHRPPTTLPARLLPTAQDPTRSAGHPLQPPTQYPAP